MSADSGDRLPEGDEMNELSSTLPVQLSLLASEGLTQRESERIANATPPVERLSFDRFLNVLFQLKDRRLMKGSFVMGGLSLCSSMIHQLGGL